MATMKKQGQNGQWSAPRKSRRRKSLLGWMVLLAAFAGIGQATADEPKSPKEPVVLLFDPFEGKKFLNWKPVRFDPSHISFSKHPRQLTIITQRGTIFGDHKSREEPIAKNFYVLENPLPSEADFTVTTCLTHFEPSAQFHQAGLICYEDDDNYVKYSCQFSSTEEAGSILSMVTETKGEGNIEHAPRPVDAKSLWLRIEKRSKQYQFLLSTDGKEYSKLRFDSWEGSPKWVGIYAKNGGRDDIPEIDAVFDFFDLRSLAPVEKKEIEKK